MSRILVTGAAGLIGGEVCARLVAAGHEVTALIHRNPQVCGNDGWDVPVVESVPCDIRKDRLGLDRETFDRLARTQDLVVHCAATIRFDLTDAEYAEVNTAGTANVLALAEAGGAGLLHVSTAYVCGTRNGTILEDDPLPEADGFANGYEASKAAAEGLVRASGIEWAIARPGITLGEYESGRIRQFDALYLAFKLMAEGRIRLIPAAEDASLGFVPLDHVAGGIVALVQNWEAARGRTCHLVASEPLPMADFAAGIGGVEGLHAPTLVDPTEFDPATLPPLERRLNSRVSALYASYFQRDPRFDDRNFRALTGMASRPADRAYLNRLIDFCIAEGFLPAAPVLAN
ncbi:SDR family oxidoreductase [Alteriqipengyuania lutimaris]|uniref:NAD-dependent epimerase/dehydratase family protein n=1 Tax=Alteriqipengyuania lutimaris TaxID=1538146 RepID=A0A395LKR7_9SPHN|nr:SDR family oxidoreductase [Alteriqipengyuania lutimaris]MBB3033590.1 nucleoside-diphosphate-sugar epimerase [Alteriqipengyuania lutimaris]RDS77411.1 NAD-dependent epimerase/dehydratase family protein [Alteriqipengyuania lutimaris]